MSLCILIFGALATGQANAAANYSFLDAGAVEEQRPGAITGGGPLVAASLAFDDHLFMFGEYQDESSGGMPLHDHAAGFGAHFALSQTLDLAVSTGWAAKTSLQKTDRGWVAKLALRWTLDENVELEPGIWRTSPGRGVNQFYTDVRYNFRGNWVLGFGIANGDSDNLIRTYIRWYF